MATASRALNVHLGASKAPWVAYCQKLGKAPGAAIKEAIDAQLAQQQAQPASMRPAPPKRFRQTTKPTPGQGKKRVELLLTESEKAAVIERAALEECSPRRWMIDAIRAGLTHQPQFGMEEVRRLGESNYQLLLIGRNLNQMARRLNEDSRAPITAQSIERLSAKIDKHTEAVANAMRASLERWNLE